MIIECPTCHARFRLDETKIKGKGARVRCRRCGDAIMVVKPEIPESPPPPAPDRGDLDLRSIVRETLGEDPLAFSGPAAAETGLEATPPPAPKETVEAPPPEPSVPPLKDDVDEAFEKFLATTGLETPAGGTESREVLPDLAGPTDDLRAVTQPPKEGREETSSDFLISGSDAADLIRMEYAKEGSQESFDISSDVRQEPAPRQDEAKREPRFLADEGGAASLPPSADEAPPSVPETPAAKLYPPRRPPEPTAAASSFLRPSVIVLVLLFLIIAGGGGFLGFTKSGQEILKGFVPGMESLWLRSGGKTGPQYDVRNLIGYYEANAKAGNLFVVKGQVTNTGRARRSGIRIHAALLDGKDKPVMEKTCYAGNVLPGDVLRTSPREKIEEALGNRFGDSLVNMDIPPGKSIPFMLVFYDPPEGINAYRLEAKDGE
jgi:predicted Zn finger-like uncharacterized protein